MITGTQIKKYKIISKIADGGMGIVYKAFDTEKQRDVAIKVIHSKFAFETNIRKRFIDEAHIQAKLKQPNICTLIHAFDHVNRLFLVMEFLDGCNLKELIQNKGEIPPNEAVDIVLQILDALNCAHKNNVVHRDIKPSNIMIMPDGKVKVMDFGIAKSLTDERLTETKTGEKLGTPAYMSPEQIIGRKVDARTDFYSLGIVLYEMLTGRLPFKDKSSDYEIEQFHVQGEMPSLIDNTDCPTWLNDVIQKSVSKSPVARFSSAENFKKALSAKKIIPKKSRINTRLILLACKYENEVDFNRYLKEAIKVAKNEKDQLTLLNLYEQLGDEWKAKAEFILDYLLEQEPSENIRLKIAYYFLLLSRKKYNQAIKIIFNILEVNPNNIRAIELVEQIIDSLIKTNKNKSLKNISLLILENNLISVFRSLSKVIKYFTSRNTSQSNEYVKKITEKILTKDLDDTVNILEDIIPLFLEKNHINTAKKISEYILKEQPDNINALNYIELIYKKEYQRKEEKRKARENTYKSALLKAKQFAENNKWSNAKTQAEKAVNSGYKDITDANKWLAFINKKLHQIKKEKLKKRTYNDSLIKAKQSIEDDEWDSAQLFLKKAIKSGYSETKEADKLLIATKEKLKEIKQRQKEILENILIQDIINKKIISKHIIVGITICAFIGFIIGGIISSGKTNSTVAFMVLGIVFGTTIGGVIGIITGHYIADENIKKIKQIDK